MIGNNMGCIYLATNRLNGKQYVGQTTRTLRIRRNQHKSDAKLLENPCCVITRAIRKHGFENFDWIEVESDVPDEDLDRLEIENIKWFGSKHPKGYNLTNGGDGPERITEEMRRKASASVSKLWKDDEYRSRMIAAHEGKEVEESTRALLSVKSKERWLNPDYRRKIVNAQKGKKLTPEHKAKISKANKGRKGKPLSDEHKAKISKASTGRVMPDSAKKQISQTLMGHEVTEDTRRKCSLALKGRKNPEQSLRMKGRKHTPESNRKISKSLLGKRKSELVKVNISKSAKRRSPEAMAKSIEGLMKFNQQRAKNGISDEYRKRLSESHKGKKLTEEHKAKISLAFKVRREQAA